MTEMKRTTISMPDELDKAVFELRKSERYMRCSYSEIVRTLVEIGLEVVRNTNGNTTSANQSN